MKACQRNENKRRPWIGEVVRNKTIIVFEAYQRTNFQGYMPSPALGKVSQRPDCSMLTEFAWPETRVGRVECEPADHFTTAPLVRDKKT